MGPTQVVHKRRLSWCFTGVSQCLDNSGVPLSCAVRRHKGSKRMAGSHSPIDTRNPRSSAVPWRWCKRALVVLAVALTPYIRDTATRSCGSDRCFESALVELPEVLSALYPDEVP